jgi:hypothetical protein
VSGDVSGSASGSGVEENEQPPRFHACLGRITSMMEGRHNLADKLSVISTFLDDEDKPEGDKNLS